MPAIPVGAVENEIPVASVRLRQSPGTDADHPTRVEVSFTADGKGTRVEVRHGPTPKSADLYESRAPRYAASWDLVLAALARAVGA